MNIKFTTEDWARIEKTHMDFWNGELKRPLLFLHKKQETRMPPAPGFWAHLPNDMPAEEVIMHYEAQLEASDGWVGDNFPKRWVNFGPGILAGFIGAKVGIDKNTVWFDPDGNPKISEINPTLDKDNFWYKRIMELTKVAAERWKGKAAVGYTDIGGNLDVAASLRGTQDLLLDCMDEPQEVQRVCKAVTEIWIEVFNELSEIIEPNGCGHTPWGPIWTKPGVTTYMLQSDFCYMISPAMFEEFVLPDLYSCCDAIDVPFYHLDGKGELPHLDMLIDIPKLAGIQWIPGDGAPHSADWPDVLSKIKKGGKKCQVFVSPQEAVKIVREHGGRNFIMEVFGEFTPQEAIDFQNMLKKESID